MTEALFRQRLSTEIKYMSPKRIYNIAIRDMLASNASYHVISVAAAGMLRILAEAYALQPDATVSYGNPLIAMLHGGRIPAFLEDASVYRAEHDLQIATSGAV